MVPSKRGKKRPLGVKEEYSEIQYELVEMEDLLQKLHLTSVILGDYVVFLRSDFDLTLAGEPYIAVMLLLNRRSGGFLARIWNRTVTVGNAITKRELSTVLCDIFDRGRPCIGIPQEDEGEPPHFQHNSESLIYVKSSRACHLSLGKGADPDTVSCKECLKLCAPSARQIPDVKCKVEIEETEEAESMLEHNEAFEPFGNKDDNFDNFENDEDKDFSTQEDLNEDSDWNDGGEDIETESKNQCNMCGSNFAKKSKLTLHYRKVHLWGEFKCSDCEFTAEFVQVLIKHMQENEHQSLVACPNCPKKGDDLMFSEGDISLHYKDCLKRTVKSKCPCCDFASMSATKMIEHKKIAHLWGQFGCLHCDYR